MCTQERPKILQTPISLHVTEQIFREDSLHLHLSQHNWQEAQEDTQLASYSSLHTSVFWSGKWGYVTHIDMLRCWCRAQPHKAQPFRLTGIYWRLLLCSFSTVYSTPPTHTHSYNQWESCIKPPRFMLTSRQQFQEHHCPRPQPLERKDTSLLVNQECTQCWDLMPATC